MFNHHPDGSCGVWRTFEIEAYYVSFKEIVYVSVFTKETKWARIFYCEYSSKEEALKAMEPWIR